MSIYKSRTAEPLVSVVTPFYNSGRHLSQCIESVLAQTYHNWEHLLINNCSCDDSLDIAMSYAKYDSRIRVVDCDIFLNQVQNYNRALKYISEGSQYTKVVQADDWIFAECISEMVDVAERNQRVAVVGAYALEGGANTLWLDGLPTLDNVFCGNDICKSILMGGPYVFGTPTSTLIRSELIRARSAFYSESSLFEDADVCFELLNNRDFGFVHKVLTVTRRDNQSIMTKQREFYPTLLFNVVSVARYGKVFLTDDEFRRRSKEVRWRYFRFLGESALSRRDSEFWCFQAEGLATIGERINWATLASYVVLAVIDLTFNPLDTLLAMAKKTIQATRVVGRAS
jgi:glycosyltransferase involved in cell wall biosynthesis